MNHEHLTIYILRAHSLLLHGTNCIHKAQVDILSLDIVHESTIYALELCHFVLQ